jgi:hypothetical protein
VHVLELEDLAAVGRPGRRALGDSLGHCATAEEPR